ncbi:fumarylacetoacetate hydrolase family protein [Nocardiopsis salina]|uniref:fumarylacetoacetate hydrolase family protein n=1 Tax=Nocardiopsis salina TaxID=245836 RepID=UPI00034672F9|nr:fumarylacetoacetate hydrolase family protein [Nocardiopsis salina]
MTAPVPLLPEDADRATLVGRVWDPETGGPRPVLVRGEQVHDLFSLAPTVSALLESEDALRRLQDVRGRPRWNLAELAAAPDEPGAARLLAPVDLQVVKACGVTFADSMVERVIEERCAGDPARAEQVRATVTAAVGSAVGGVEPGSEQARAVKEVLVERGLWSQYLEVGLGPDPEVFTKAPVLASVGYGARVGIPAFSQWNNPEPELVLAVDPRGRPRGCTLGNDVNLRDVEGRSALLLGMAKDNNASSALGPLLRLFDDTFTLDSVREERVRLRVEGAQDGFTLEGENHVGRLSRSFEQLVSATSGAHHQYPDGFVLYTGTLFAPTRDRDRPGEGFTHKDGDRVTISSPHLGSLRNTVGSAEELPRWEFGVGSLFSYLSEQRPTARPRGAHRHVEVRP